MCPFDKLIPSHQLPDDPRLTADPSIDHLLDHAGYCAQHAP